MAGLPPVVERLVLHWGEMGSLWNVNRSVSQIHALLYFSERPLAADEIADLLGIARSNVSTSIKELVSLRLIRMVHVMGDDDPKTPAHVKAKIKSTLGFLETLHRWYEDMKGLPHPLFMALLRMGARVQRYLKSDSG